MDDRQPLVSVVIPTYQRATLVVEAIDSVLAQTWARQEIIVIVDGSDDGTATLLRRYGDRIRLVEQDNRGLNAVRNRALGMAQGEYIALLDDDDLWRPHKTEFQVRVLEAIPAAAFTFSDFSVFRADGTESAGLASWGNGIEEWCAGFAARRTFDARELPVLAAMGLDSVATFTGDIYHHSLHHPYVLPSASLIRRASIAALRFEEKDSTCGDWEFFARLSRCGGAVFTRADTARNRSHEGATRLTRVREELQLARRVAMTERVWGADADFRGAHEAEYSVLLSQLLTRLGLLHLLTGQRDASRRTLERAAQLDASGFNARLAALRAFAAVPGAAAMLGAARDARRWLRRGD